MQNRSGTTTISISNLSRQYKKNETELSDFLTDFFLVHDKSEIMFHFMHFSHTSKLLLYCTIERNAAKREWWSNNRKKREGLGEY